MNRSTGGDLLTMTLAALAIAVCCGMPLVIAFLVTTGLGAVLLTQGWLLLGLLLLAVGLGLGVRYLMRDRGMTKLRRGGDAQQKSEGRSG